MSFQSCAITGPRGQEGAVARSQNLGTPWAAAPIRVPSRPQAAGFLDARQANHVATPNLLRPLRACRRATVPMVPLFAACQACACAGGV